jgi:hypothetical protein
MANASASYQWFADEAAARVKAQEDQLKQLQQGMRELI